MGQQGRHALVIGIDEYPYFPPQNQLKTCVADAELMAGLFEDHFGFPRQNVRLLRNREATRDGIVGALEELTERTSDDDAVVIHYSGHGSWKRDPTGWNPDGISETVVPYDSGRSCFEPKHENLDILDREIHDWLLRLNERTANVTLIFDSCHAGTITRHPSVGIRRAPPDDGPGGSGERPLRRQRRFKGRFGDHHALIAACREDEHAHEFHEVELGALTYFVYQELLRARPGDTYRDLFERFAPQVTGVFRDQRPQLEGSWDREIFGLRDFEPMRYVAVRSREGRHVVLGAGKAHGLTSGSEWSIYPTGTRQIDASPCGKVRLTSVSAVKSRGEILEEESTTPIDAGSRAVELAHVYDEQRWTVEIRGAPPVELRRALEGALEASPLLALARPGEGAARIHYLTPRDDCKEVPQLRGFVRAETWAAVGQSGSLLLKPLPGDARHLGELMDALGRWSRYDFVRQLRNVNPGSALAGRVIVNVLRRAGEHWQPAEVDDAVFAEGDGLAITVTNAHDSPIYVSVLDLGLSGAVSQVYPPAGVHSALVAGRTLEIGIREGDELEVFLPENFPFGPRDKAEGEECIKVFATARQADFRWLTQASAVRGVGHPLERLLRGTFEGPVRGDTRRIATDDWTTVECAFLVRRQGA